MKKLLPALITLALAQIAGFAAPAGAKITFLATADGSPAPTFQWWKDGAPIAGATGATFIIASLKPSDAGAYKVVASNIAGSAESNVELVAVDRAKPKAPSNPQVQRTAKL